MQGTDRTVIKFVEDTKLRIKANLTHSRKKKSTYERPSRGCNITGQIQDKSLTGIKRNMDSNPASDIY